MSKNRMETFSDGVLAIIITLMGLELTIPHGADPAVLRPLIPIFLSYVLSFVFLGIYWNNHHHLMQVVQRVDVRVLWANLHLLSGRSHLARPRPADRENDGIGKRLSWISTILS